MEASKSEIIALLNNKASIKAGQQRYDTMLEQINIRKAELTKRLLERKSEENDLKNVLGQYEEEYKKTCEVISDLNSSMQEMEQKAAELEEKTAGSKRDAGYGEAFLPQGAVEAGIVKEHRGALRGIRKQYPQRVMEQKENEAGLLGVVADIIKVDKKYETAIETALGGNIQNIVTEDETTAKRMIGYLKKNRLGRATFLPLTSVRGKDNSKNEKYLAEEGILGFANTLVQTQEKYAGVLSYLLGRVLVADTIDHALALAKKSQYSLHIVTLEGEYLSPGGSLAGGAFKNNSNLLGRKREIDTLEQSMKELVAQIKSCRARSEEIKTAQALLAEDIESAKVKLQEQYLAQNTAEMNLKRAKDRQEESENVYAGLRRESKEIEAQIAEIAENKEKITDEIEVMAKREKEIGEENNRLQSVLEEQTKAEDAAKEKAAKIQMEEAGFLPGRKNLSWKIPDVSTGRSRI